MKVQFNKDGILGILVYDEEKKTVDITFKGNADKLLQYLTKKRNFRIPESQQFDDDRIDTVKPTENKDYFAQALTEAFTHTGFWIEFDTLEGY